MPGRPRVVKPRVAFALILAHLTVGGASSPAQAQGLLDAPERRTATLRAQHGAYDDPVLAFSRIADLSLDSLGNLYILQNRTGTVTVLAPDGTHLETMGGRGGGPGEFVMPTGLGWSADTLTVVDPGQSRTTWLFGGEAVRTEPFPRLESTTGERVLSINPVGSGGSLILMFREFSGRPGNSDNYFPFYYLPPSGRAVPVGRLQESSPFRVTIHHSEGESELRPLFVDFPVHSVTDDGAEFAVVDRPFSMRSTAAHLTISRITARGDTLFSVSGTVDALPLTDSQWKATLERAYASIDRPRIPYTMKDVETASPRPAHWPAVTRVVAAQDGRTWVKRGGLPEDEQAEWVVLDRRGRPVFSVGLPADLTVFDVRGDDVVGVFSDELGVPFVRVFAVGR